MDIENPERGRTRRRRRRLAAVGGVGALAVVTLLLVRFGSAVPVVDRETLLLDTVRRGEMVRRVRGAGVLTSIEARLVASPLDAQVDRIAVEPGTRVTETTVLIELSDPVVRQTALEAHARLAEAEASYARLSAELESELVALDAQVAVAESEAEQARLRAEADARLAEEGLIPGLNEQLTATRAREMARRSELARQRADKGRESAAAQLVAESARVDQAREQAALRQEQVDGLRVRARIAGVLERVEVEVGERVVAGATLARVTRPERLKAVLRIPESQAKHVSLRQPVVIDTRNGEVAGLVARIDPVVRDGTVTVDVELVGELPTGARAELSVDGTIEFERVEDALFVGRPVFAQAERTIYLFRIEPDGKSAVRVGVLTGRSSVNSIEILEGLAEGDRVILSDVSDWEGYDRVRVK